MQITRRYTAEGQDPFAAFTFVPRTSRIANPDGSVVFEMKDLLAPEHWSQVAVDILAQKYFRQAGVPPQTERVPEAGVPEWLQRSGPSAGDPRSGQETDARQVFRRLAGCWTYWGWKGGYFSTRGRRPGLLRRDLPHAGGPDGGAQLAAVVQHRPALGLRHRRARPGALPRRSARPARWRAPRRRTSSRRRMPASSSRSSDDLVNEGGIMDLWVREARIFKYGSRHRHAISPPCAARANRCPAAASRAA